LEKGLKKVCHAVTALNSEYDDIRIGTSAVNMMEMDGVVKLQGLMNGPKWF